MNGRKAKVMRRNPQPRKQTPLSSLLSSLDGARIPGGCGSCDAYQTIEAQQGDPNVHALKVHHDDQCPEYQRMRGEA